MHQFFGLISLLPLLHVECQDYRDPTVMFFSSGTLTLCDLLFDPPKYQYIVDESNNNLCILVIVDCGKK